jgi:hypothetical protein
MTFYGGSSSGGAPLLSPQNTGDKQQSSNMLRLCQLHPFVGLLQRILHEPFARSFWINVVSNQTSS